MDERRQEWPELGRETVAPELHLRLGRRVCPGFSDDQHPFADQVALHRVEDRPVLLRERPIRPHPRPFAAVQALEERHVDDPIFQPQQVQRGALGIRQGLHGAFDADGGQKHVLEQRAQRGFFVGKPPTFRDCLDVRRTQDVVAHLVQHLGEIHNSCSS